MSSRLAGYLFCAAVVACVPVSAGQTQGDAQGKMTQQGNSTTAPTPKPEGTPAVGAPVDPNAFIIGPEDVLGITVWRQPDFSRSYRVRPDGKITIPLIGDVDAAGQTPAQLAKSLAVHLSKLINNPQVDVSVLTVNSKKYYINGGVLKTGAFPLVVPTTVLQALSEAGGFKDFANTKKIVILRKGKRLKFNYKDVTHGKHMEENIYLENGDLIIVPD
jgi:polysaccharide biosynthesis/export protein